MNQETPDEWRSGLSRECNDHNVTPHRPVFVPYQWALKKKVKWSSAPLYRHWGSAQAVQPIGGVEVQLYSFLTTALEGGWGVSVTPRSLFTPGKDPVPIVQEAGWAPGPVWNGAEYFALTGIRSPDRPARSQSLYRLSYPAHINGPYHRFI